MGSGDRVRDRRDALIVVPFLTAMSGDHIANVVATTTRQMSFEFDPEASDASLPTDSVEPWADVARRIAARVAAVVGEPVRLLLTENRRTMLSATRVDGRVVLRLHHVFLRAGEDVWDAIGEYVREGGGKASPAIGEHLAAYRDELLAARVERTPIRERGRHHDLGKLLEDLSMRHFGGSVGARITWGARGKGPGRRRRSIKLGSYAPDEGIIRIHPLLDQAWVPTFFVESVIFHEMLHHVVPPVTVGGKRLYHTKAFRALEQCYEHQEEAERWERENLAKLLGVKKRRPRVERVD